MTLFEFINNELKINVRSYVEFTGMTDSTRPKTLSFLDNTNFAGALRQNKNIIAALVRRQDMDSIPENIEAVAVENPKAIFFDLHNAYCKKYLKFSPSVIAKSASIHPSAFVSDEGVIIGENVLIGPHSTVLSGVQIGDNTTIGPNCVIGSEGFHVFTDSGGVKRMAIHDGSVIIGNNVDLQASVTLDKGLMGRDTIIGDECKLDNFVHIAHRVHLAEKCFFASGARVAGSANIGRNVWMGPGSVVSNRIDVGDDAKILIGAVAIRNIKPKSVVSGNFAVRHEKHMLSQCETR